MSVIYITQHDENIYNVTEKQQKQYVKPPRYISAFNKVIKNEKETKKKPAYGTMGPAETLPEDPKNFLRKHSRKGVPKQVTKEPCQKSEMTLPVSHFIKDEGKHKIEKVRENYIRKNVLNIKKIEPPPVIPKYVDTRYGTTHELERSGLEPKYRVNGQFGRAPNYLLGRMRAKELEQQHEKDSDEIQQLPKCRYVTRQEREDLLNGLKKNWEQLQKEFQLLPIITDTIPKVLKKVKLEKDLAQLEKDITMIEKHPYIYIDDTVYSEASNDLHRDQLS